MVTSVEVHFFAAARAAVGHPVLAAEPGRLSVLLDRIVASHPDFAAVRPRCSYLVDGVTLHGDDVDVLPGSRVDVLPPFAGG